MDALTVSVVLLWLAVIALGLMLWALSRQVGVLFERVAPMGALVTDAGPSLGQLSPSFELRGIQRERSPLAARPNSRAALLPSPTCPVCKKLIPVLKSMQRDERSGSVVLASDGERPSICASSTSKACRRCPYVLSTDLGMSYRVSRLPYAVLIDAQGVVRAKGLMNSREQLDSLLNAQ